MFNYCLGILLQIFCYIVSMSCNELFMSTPQILDHRGIPYEQHQVVTEDGYILTMYRLSREHCKGVVVLLPSLSLDSSMYLLSEKRSIAMDIHNENFELWLPNYRGLPNSKAHANANIKNLDYWNFSFHEIGYYDYPAIINHITNQTGAKVIVITFSMSATASLIYSSLRPEDAERNVKVFVNMACSAFMGHMQSPLKHFTGLQLSLMKPVMEAAGLGAIHDEFSSFEKLSKRVAMMFLPRKLLKASVELVLNLMFGKSEMGIDEEEFPLIVSWASQAVAVKVMYHYDQIISSGRFCMYDYGLKENRKRYNASEPLDYPLHVIRAPILLVSSAVDTLTDPWGANKLYETLPNRTKIYGRIELSNLNHADFVIGKNRFEYFERILKFINSV